MKKIFVTILSLAVLASACKNKNGGRDHKDTMKHDTTPTASKEEKHEEPPMNPAEMEKKWMEYATPSSVHEMMKSWDGEWTAHVVSWMPDGSVDSSTGKSVNKTIMDGRYQISNYSGTMMKRPFEGMSTLAYDNAKKTFISTWIDSWGTGLMVSEGTWDDATKTITFTGKMMNGATGKEEDFKQTLRIVDDNTQVSEMYSVKDGKDQKWMEITYTRKGAKKKA